MNNYMELAINEATGEVLLLLEYSNSLKDNNLSISYDYDKIKLLCNNKIYSEHNFEDDDYDFIKGKSSLDIVLVKNHNPFETVINNISCSFQQ